MTDHMAVSTSGIMLPEVDRAKAAAAHDRLVAQKREEAAERMAAMEAQKQLRAEQRALVTEERNAFMQAVAANRQAFARGEIGPTNPKTLPRLSGLLPQRNEELKAATKSAIAEQANSPHALKAWIVPPGSKFAPSKEELVNRE